MSIDLYNDMPDDELFARTLYGESRGETGHGKEAVANVIMTRATNPRWWGRSIRGVLLKERQFSCLWEEGANREALLAATPADPAFATCLAIAKQAIAGELPDYCGGADSYCVVGTDPYWSKGLQPVITIGRHEFYRTRS